MKEKERKRILPCVGMCYVYATKNQFPACDENALAGLSSNLTKKKCTCRLIDIVWILYAETFVYNIKHGV